MFGRKHKSTTIDDPRQGDAGIEMSDGVVRFMEKLGFDADEINEMRSLGRDPIDDPSAEPAAREAALGDDATI